MGRFTLGLDEAAAFLFWRLGDWFYNDSIDLQRENSRVVDR